MPIKSSSLKDEYQNQQIEDYENKSCQPALVDYQALYESMSTFRQNPHQTKYQELSVFVQHHECDDCSMAFSCSSQLAEHLRIHQVEKAPRDDEEAKAFRHRASFTRLQSVDTLDKHFECDQCGETFNRASKFIQHQSTHSRLKPHKCDVCPRAFQFLSSLITHQRFHAGKSPRLAQHQRTPERNKLFVCTGTHLGASLERDAGRERVHYPRTKASSAQPFAPGPEGSELPANPLTCGRTRFARVTAERRVPDAAGLFPRNSLQNWNADSAENWIAR
ncbi:hypothetical protein MJT46_011726 [Ovis ammon polii x Ovis aries]|nr:hypothetical protein MJT46_011726 [Ovis ammon polii x Ovis aries]